VPADSCVRVGSIVATIPADAPSGELRLELSLRWDGGEAENLYCSRVD
jgi:hypothetical protein